MCASGPPLATLRAKLCTVADRDISALASYQLVPRLLHDVHELSSSLELLGQTLDAPVIPLLEGSSRPELDSLSVVQAEHVLAQSEGFDYSCVVPLLKSEKMGQLMPKVRKLAAKNVPALALDLSVLGETPPFGENEWRPKTREDLAELAAAAGCPFWLYGILSPADAEIAAEAGLDALVVSAGAGYYLDGPATVDIFPEIFDTAAGMISVYAGGPVRSGVDIFKYLAVGAEAVVVDSDRSLANLTAELHYAMRLTGCETLADIGYDSIFAPLFSEM